jgi:hypothetical protein
MAQWERTVSGLYPRIRGSRVPAAVFDEDLRHFCDYRRSRPAAR